MKESDSDFCPYKRPSDPDRRQPRCISCSQKETDPYPTPLVSHKPNSNLSLVKPYLGQES